MADSILPQSSGVTLKIGPPASGDIVIIIDPSQTGSPFAMGIERLLPKAEIPAHRHADREIVVFVHKGQGRATVGERRMTVVPGSVIHAPKHAWYGLRNTGNGVLEFAWVSAPAGIERFFRELSQLGPAADSSAFQDVAARHGIELAPAGALDSPHAEKPAHGRRRRRGRGHGRGRARPGQAQAAQAVQPASTPPPAAPPLAASVSSSPSPQTRPGGSGRRHRRRRGARRGSATGPLPVGGVSPRPLSREASPSGQRGAPRSSARHSRPPAARSPRSRPTGRGMRRFESGKEVYMGGRWVRVRGEGPMIATGEERTQERRTRSGESDEPHGPLSVPL